MEPMKTVSIIEQVILEAKNLDLPKVVEFLSVKENHWSPELVDRGLPEAYASFIVGHSIKEEPQEVVTLGAQKIAYLLDFLLSEGNIIEGLIAEPIQMELTALDTRYNVHVSHQNLAEAVVSPSPIMSKDWSWKSEEAYVKRRKLFGLFIYLKEDYSQYKPSYKGSKNSKLTNNILNSRLENSKSSRLLHGPTFYQEGELPGYEKDIVVF